MKYTEFCYYALMILFWKLHNIAHTDHIWFTTPNIVNGTILSHTFHMDTKEGNWLCLNHFLRAHFPPYFPKRWYIHGDSKGEKILHSKHLICHDRVSSVKWQIDNLSVRDMASLELADKGSWGEYTPLYRLYRYVQNFKNIKLTHEMVIRLSVVCEIPYRWLKCSSLNPCLNIQRVKKILPLGLIVLVFLAWGHLIHTSIINSSWVIRMPVLMFSPLFPGSKFKKTL